MIAIDDMFREPVAQALGWALLQFVWQGALVGLLTAVLLALLRRSAADVRYVVSTVALALMLTMPVVTTIQTLGSGGQGSVGHVLESGALSAGSQDPGLQISGDASSSAGPGLQTRSSSVAALRLRTSNASALESIEDWLPMLLRVWLAGVAMLTLRLLSGWMWVQRMKSHEAQPVHESLEAVGHRLMRRLHIVRAVRFFESRSVDVPTVIGWVSPVVLLPVSALAGLTPRAGRGDSRARARPHPAARLSSSTCCRRWWKRCCSITRPSGGSLIGFESSAKTAATISRSASAAIRWPMPRRSRSSRGCARRAGSSRSRRAAARCCSGSSACWERRRTLDARRAGWRLELHCSWSPHSRSAPYAPMRAGPVSSTSARSSPIRFMHRPPRRRLHPRRLRRSRCRRRLVRHLRPFGRRRPAPPWPSCRRSQRRRSRTPHVAAARAVEAVLAPVATGRIDTRAIGGRDGRDRDDGAGNRGCSRGLVSGCAGCCGQHQDCIGPEREHARGIERQLRLVGQRPEDRDQLPGRDRVHRRRHRRRAHEPGGHAADQGWAPAGSPRTRPSSSRRTAPATSRASSGRA